jgi:hypothetical protein
VGGLEGVVAGLALLGTPEPDDVERDGLPGPWRKFLGGCTGRRLANRLPDFAAVLAGLAGLAQAAPPPATATVQPAPAVRALSDTPGGLPAPARELFVLRGKGVAARGYESAAGFVVLAGSQAVKEAVPSLPPSVVQLRRSLMRQGHRAPQRGCVKGCWRWS